VNWNDASVVGRLEVDVTDWLSRDWVTNELLHFERDQAFELLTTNPPACPPRCLRAARDGTNLVELSWAGVGYALQAAWALEADPARTAWRTLGYASPLTVPLEGAHRFFRLVCPPPAPDFAVSLDRPDGIILPGTNVSLSLMLTSLNGFNSPVWLSCTGLPPGVVANYNPTPVTPLPFEKSNRTLSLSVTSSATTGTYEIQLVGTAGPRAGPDRPKSPPKEWAPSRATSGDGLAHVLCPSATSRERLWHDSPMPVWPDASSELPWATIGDRPMNVSEDLVRDSSSSSKFPAKPRKQDEGRGRTRGTTTDLSDTLYGLEFFTANGYNANNC
jgi:hypothetical protein